MKNLKNKKVRQVFISFDEDGVCHCWYVFFAFKLSKTNVFDFIKTFFHSFNLFVPNCDGHSSEFVHKGSFFFDKISFVRDRFCLVISKKKDAMNCDILINLNIVKILRVHHCSTVASEISLICVAVFTQITLSSVSWKENFVSLHGSPLSTLLTTLALCFFGEKHKAFIFFSFSWIVNEKYSDPLALLFTGLTLWR